MKPDTFSSCIQFLDAAIMGRWADARGCLAGSGLSSDDFSLFVAQHDIAPYLSWRLGTAGGFAELPGWVRVSLMAFHRRDKEHREQLLTGLQQISAAAGQAGIDFLLLKGPCLSQRYFNSLEARRICDLDLLAPPSQGPAMENLLEELGFSGEARPAFRSRWHTYFVHAREFFNQHYSVDLHTAIRVRPAYQIDHQAIWQECQTDIINGTAVQAPSDQHNLLILLLSIAGDLELGKLRMKSLVDLQAVTAIIESHGEWDVFFQKRDAESLESIAVNILTLLLQVLPRSCEFPRLMLALDRRRGLRVPCTDKSCHSLLTASPFSVSNRQWFLSIYPGSQLYYLLWLAMGIPFKKGFFSAIKRTVAGRSPAVCIRR